MSTPDAPGRRAVATVARYGMAVSSVAAALAVTLLFRPGTLVAPVFFLAIILTAWFGGMLPGLLAALLATLAIDYFVLDLDPTNVPQLLVFFLSAVLVSSWSAGRRRAETALQRARDDLEATVRERTAALTQANDALRAEIADRRRVDQLLRERASLLDLTHDTVFVRDMRDVITFWNRGAEELYGWKQGEALGQASHQLMRTVFPAPLERINAELLTTGRWEGELIHTKRDGTRVVVASRWSLQRDEQGDPVAILETNNDVTARRRTEEALRESEEQWRAIFENNPTMYLTVAAAGMVLSVNPFGAEQLGYAVEELLGRPVLNVYYEADREAVRNNVASCLARLGQTMRWELRKVRKDGTVLWVRETAKAVLMKNRPVVLVVCEDITERKRAEEALRKAQADLAHVSRVTTLGELAASMAHEINQPLAAIAADANASLNWLARVPPDLESVGEGLAAIVKDAHRAADVIQRVRDLAARTEPRKTRLDVNRVIEEVLLLVRAEVLGHQVSLRLDLAPALPPVLGDRVQLQQVLINLLVNGVEAMAAVTDRPRELLIRSRRHDGDQVLVAVQDSGVGIDPRDIDRLFDAFFTTKSEGLGMGLSISRSIAEGHGGRLWATPNPTHGATFHLALPVEGVQEDRLDDRRPVPGP